MSKKKRILSKISVRRFVRPHNSASDLTLRPYFNLTQNHEPNSGQILADSYFLAKKG